eukprot:g37986.t1
MKCFERLVMAHIISSLLPGLNPLQFAYRHSRSTENTMSLDLHSSLEHLDIKYTYVRFLFVDYRSAFNTIIPYGLISKLRDLGLSSTLCNRILSFLTHRPQSMKIGGELTPKYIIGTEVERVKSIKFLGDRKNVVYIAQTIMEANLPSMDSIYTAHCCGKAANIIKGPLHP